MKKYLGLVGLLSTVLISIASTTSFASTLVVTDIDDTLKQSHILNRRDMVEFAMLTTNPFLAMNGIFIALKHDQPDAKIVYLTTAIDTIMHGFHSKFLEVNQFPPGSLLLRQSILDSNFKVTELRKLMKTEHPERVILIGDNGEKDTQVYDQIRKEFPQVQFLIYIHQLYSTHNNSETGSALMPGEVGFATSFDLMLDLTAAAMVKPETTGKFYEAYSKKFIEEDSARADGAVAFPRWMDCRDFQWTSPDFPEAGPSLPAVKDKIIKRCGQQRL